MGLLFARFKKKVTTFEVLEGLEQEIKAIEENGLRAEQRQRRIVGHLILYSVGLYVIAAFLFYLFYFPAPLKEQIIYIAPMLLFPILVVFLKRLVSWYYHRKLSQNREKLKKMQEKKKTMLEEVMDKETYKVAKEILEKFAPDQLRKQLPVSPVQLRSPQAQVNTSLPLPQLVQQPAGQAAITDMALRRRSVGQPAASRPFPSPPSARSASLGPVSVASGQADGRGLRSLPIPPGPPMPRPVFPRERSYAERLMEYILGDSPSNRYALICRQCESHNGMALKEEFEYLAFRCCYCYYWNPARKLKPHAPTLTQPAAIIQSSSTSSSELNSASDSDDEQPGPEENASTSELISDTVEPMSAHPSEGPSISEKQAGSSQESEPLLGGSVEDLENAESARDIGAEFTSAIPLGETSNCSTNDKSKLDNISAGGELEMETITNKTNNNIVD